MKVKAKNIIHDHITDDHDNQNLTANKIYTVIGIDFESYRVINDINEPILYSKKLFDVIDSEVPESWIRSDYGDGEYYIDPPEFSEQGFYEDYFDNVPEAVKIFNNFIANQAKEDGEK